MSDRMPEDMSDRVPEDMPDRMPEDMSDRVPEDMPDRMPEDLPDRMPEDMPDHMPEDMPDRMSNRMSEDMSDRMPEDLPVRKCINVMVGITRSKVIFSIYISCYICTEGFVEIGLPVLATGRAHPAEPSSMVWQTCTKQGGSAVRSLMMFGVFWSM